jgi:hypothetical protein
VQRRQIQLPVGPEEERLSARLLRLSTRGRWDGEGGRGQTVLREIGPGKATFDELEAEGTGISARLTKLWVRRGPTPVPLSTTMGRVGSI